MRKIYFRNKHIFSEIKYCQGKIKFELELRQFKNNSDQFVRIPRLKLPRFFNHRISHALANQQSFSERRSIERRSERALIWSERERERRSNSHW